MGKERGGRGKGKGEREEEGLRTGGEEEGGEGRGENEYGDREHGFLHPSPFSVLPSGINVMKLSDA